MRLRSLNTKGIVTSLGEEEIEIQVGNLRVRTRISEVEPLGAEEPAQEEVVRKPSRVGGQDQGERPGLNSPSPGIELDLRGQRADDALDQLDRYLDAAYMAGLPFVRIIHGKGTGKLRQAVREALQGHPHLRSFQPGGANEGGDGVTVVKLKTS